MFQAICLIKILYYQPIKCHFLFLHYLANWTPMWLAHIWLFNISFRNHEVGSLFSTITIFNLLGRFWNLAAQIYMKNTFASESCCSQTVDLLISGHRWPQQKACFKGHVPSCGTVWFPCWGHYPQNMGTWNNFTSHLPESIKGQHPPQGLLIPFKAESARCFEILTGFFVVSLSHFPAWVGLLGADWCGFCQKWTWG